VLIPYSLKDMLKNANVVGRNVVKFRHQAGWTQEMLAARMQLLGGYITRDIIAQIETRRSTVNDERVMLFARVFDVEIGRLFPQNFGNKSPGDCRKKISVV
jgi:transcriptional regulator with XRE-family HTH domain